MLAAVGQGSHAQRSADEAKLETFECLVLCFKKQVAAHLPDVGERRSAAHGKGTSHAFAGDHRSKGDGDLLS